MLFLLYFVLYDCTRCIAMAIVITLSLFQARFPTFSTLFADGPTRRPTVIRLQTSTYS